ncbi:MAG: YggT family protein [Acidobacteria bacterium]|nr:MAG: YggT family protein [Acidobacteriota bacterium]
MFVAGNFLAAVARLLDFVLGIYIWVIIARALISWVNADPWNPIVQFLHRATEPVLAPIRQRLPTHRTGIDFSPLVAILAIYFVQWFLIPTLYQMAGSLR